MIGLPNLFNRVKDENKNKTARRIKSLYKVKVHYKYMANVDNEIESFEKDFLENGINKEKGTENIPTEDLINTSLEAIRERKVPWGRYKEKKQMPLDQMEVYEYF